MTFVIEHYKNTEDNLIFANIQQNKYEKSYELDVYRIEKTGSSIGHTLFRNHYVSIPNARKALYRIGNRIGKFEKYQDDIQPERMRKKSAPLLTDLKGDNTMKLYSVSIPAKDIKTVVDILSDDLTELCLDEDELLLRCSVVNAYRPNIGHISFELTDKQALLLMQTLFIYSSRMADAGDERQHPLYDFAVRLFTPLTGKTHYDF